MRCKIILVTLLFSGQIFAGIGADLENFFQNMGSVTNHTSGGAHRDQSAGY